MKICNRAVNYIQVINAEGEVRICSWRRDNIIGNLLQEDMHDILCGKKAKIIRETMMSGDYSFCDADNCPYLSNNKMEDILVNMGEIPTYPSELYLAYEGVCNYHCTCCTSYEHMKDTKKYDYSTNYDLLEEKLKKILPYVKTLSANGRGELFASKRILKLLETWKPLAPADEVKVILETNGSMFDEKHWKQIENLGQYHLSVAITIMSFDERVYQHLSGTKLPISRIEDNLRYVKSLRKKGIINHLELATVLQEENFREMPEFVKRCIEEFGADIVRIRPIFPGGIYDNNIQWFMDVRNPEHPYYEQYREVMKHPVFQNPKVLLWSGELPSTLGKHPGIKAVAIQKAVDHILSTPNFMKKLQNEIGANVNNLYLYGIGTLGKLLVSLYQGDISIKGVFDKYFLLEKWKDIPVMKPRLCTDKDGTILVTVYDGYNEIKQELVRYGFKGKIVDLYEILKEEKACENE